MPTEHQTQFEIDRTELEIIETALREQAKHISQEMLGQYQSTEQRGTKHTNQLTSRMKEIQSLLGNLHNQKIWYRPQGAVPLG